MSGLWESLKHWIPIISDTLWGWAPAFGIPLMVILEPWQPIHGVQEVRVDGEPAELDLAEEDGWTRARVQIPADAPRSVEIRGEGVTPLPG